MTGTRKCNASIELFSFRIGIDRKEGRKEKKKLLYWERELLLGAQLSSTHQLTDRRLSVMAAPKTFTTLPPVPLAPNFAISLPPSTTPTCDSHCCSCTCRNESEPPFSEATGILWLGLSPTT